METDKSVEKPKLADRPWLFQPGKPSANPKGRPKGTFSLKTFAKKYLEAMSDDEKLEFMRGLPKEVIWKMSEGAPKQDIEQSGSLNIAVNKEHIESASMAISSFLSKKNEEEKESL